MDIAELLDAARRKQGSFGTVATMLGIRQSALSNWRAGRNKPSATEIALLAEMAEIPVLETLAQVERELNADRRSVWDRALGSLRTAGATAVLLLGIAVSVGISCTPQTAHASTSGTLPSHGRGHWFDPSTTHQDLQAIAGRKARRMPSLFALWTSCGLFRRGLAQTRARRASSRHRPAAPLALITSL